MVNTDDFIKRLEIILEYYTLNASSFADKIGVQRSSLSHLLSGRNKPSLDFILKIIEVFPEVDLYWILNGKGIFPKSIKEDNETLVVKENSTTLSDEAGVKQNLFSEINFSDEVIPLSEEIKIKMNNSVGITKSEQIEKIVFFYKNGTFKTYDPN